jgi:hypothetical protein
MASALAEWAEWTRLSGNCRMGERAWLHAAWYCNVLVLTPPLVRARPHAHAPATGLWPRMSGLD